MRGSDLLTLDGLLPRILRAKSTEYLATRNGILACIVLGYDFETAVESSMFIGRLMALLDIFLYRFSH